LLAELLINPELTNDLDLLQFEAVKVEKDGEQMYGEIMSADVMIKTQAEKRRNCTVCVASTSGEKDCSCLVLGYCLYTDGTLVEKLTSRKPLMLGCNSFTTPIANKVRTGFPLPPSLPPSNLESLILSTLPPSLPPNIL